MSSGSRPGDERKQLAEKWRVLGEKLRRRSPVAYRRFVEMFVTSEGDAETDPETNIDDVYLIH